MTSKSTAFAKHVAEAMEKLVRERKVKALVVVAPPRTLADLRHAFHADVKSLDHRRDRQGPDQASVGQIEKHLVG